MKKVRLVLVLAVAIALTMAFSVPQPVMAWDCEYLGGGGGGNWGCVDAGGDLWFVDCTNGPCRYQRI